jgi:hypothetical protein
MPTDSSRVKEALARLADANRLGIARRRRIGPVALEPDHAVTDYEPLARQELADVRERGQGRGYEAERQVCGDRVVVQLVADQAARGHRLQLRAEHHQTVLLSVVERLDAEPVARQETDAAAAVPDGDSVLAAQPPAQLGPVLLPQVRQHLCVAARPEGVAGAVQLPTQVFVVVDLAVLGAPDGARLVRHRLVAPVHVHDAEAARSERDAVVEHEPGVVGAAMADRIGHALEHLRPERGSIRSVDREDSGDSAHRVSLQWPATGAAQRGWRRHGRAPRQAGGLT